ncbi:hypothetical protein C426_0486 [Lactococcus garvieae DCC43]|uniref:Calcineurin-like phosphoesterase domain-containing protein n=1 Tax=Lactococcus garvieae DCC43 TaxID=1231377 RepID=K2NXD3_9LACT|nr:hypothetical protein C426_0486 [Lactococcus garvieae DCC43]
MQKQTPKTPPRTSKKGKNKNKCVILSIITFFLFLILTLPFYARKVEPFLVHVNHVELGKKNERTPLNVVQISDLQVSKYYETDRLDKVIDEVNAQNPDILLFTGDLFDNYSKYPEQKAPMIEKLKAFKANIGKYAVWGNHDYGGGAVRVYEEVMTAGGFTVLRNQGETLTLDDGRRVFLGGLDDSLLGNPSVTDTLAYRQSYDYAITMTHEPDVADAFMGTDTQLVLAGHSHGGAGLDSFLPDKKCPC